MVTTAAQLPEGVAAATIRQVALLGNVCVGKTSLFDGLCRNQVHSVSIPGSTLSARRGVLAVGPGRTSRQLRRHCAGCKAAASGIAGCATSLSAGRCPAVSRPRRRWLLWRQAEAGRGPPSARTRGFHSLQDDNGNDLPPAAEPKAERGPTRPAPIITHLYDTPGSATLAAGSEDELIARSLLLSGRLDSVILVADAKNLRRSLALALEVAMFELPMVLNLNMADEAEGMGLEIDEEALASSFNVPVNSTVAVASRGVRRLAELIPDARIPSYQVSFPDALSSGLAKLQEVLANPEIAPAGLATLILRADPGAEAWVTEHLGEQALSQATAIRDEVQQAFKTPLPILITDALYAEAARIVDRVMTRSVRSPGPLIYFGELAQRPLTGSLIAVALLVLAYFWVGAFGATFVVDSLSTYVFDGLLIPLGERLVAPIPSELVRDAIMHPDFGILPTGLFLAIGLVLPILFCFYLLQAVAEDSGYLPRLAVLSDRLLRRLGLNGKALIPLVLGFSCITMAVITTRLLPSRRERTILTLLLILGIPCAPILAVLLVILGQLPWTASAVLFGIIATQIIVAALLAGKVLPGGQPDLILEIPKMRIPRPLIVLRKTWRRSWEFLREAAPIFMLASFVTFLFDRAGGLTLLEQAAKPVVSDLLGLPDKAVQIFIKAIIRRESGATELNLLREHFDNVQLVVTMLVMTFLMPCINALIVIVKERGLKTAAVMIMIVSTWAITAGSLLNLTCRTLGITFT